MKKTVLRIIFSCILSLLIAILCLAGGLCHYVLSTICDKQVLLTQADTSEFGQELYEQVRYNWENLLAITGVTEPESIMEILTEAQVKEDAMRYIESSYSGTADLQTDELQNQLEEKVREYAYSHNIHATPETELEQNITDLVDACISDYRSAITIPLLPRLLGQIDRFPSYLEQGMLFSAIGIGLLLLFIFFLQKKRQDTLYYASISVATGGVLITALCQLVIYYDVIARIPFSESALKTLLTAYLHVLLNALRQYGYVFIAGVIGLLCLYLIICLLIMIVKKIVQVIKKPNQ